MHFCICEVTRDDYTGLFKFEIIEDFVDDQKSADEFCSSLVNFSRTLKDVWYCVRCFTDYEFINLLNKQLLAF